MNRGGAKVALVSEVLDRLLDEYGDESGRRFRSVPMSPGASNRGSHRRRSKSS